MDTTPQYQNILNAIKGQPEGLTTAERVENYNLVEKLNQEGKRLADILKQAEEKRTPEDPEIFGIMEAAVRNDPKVKDARQRLADTKSAVLAKICYQYPEYREAMDEYRKEVAETYKAKIGKGSDDPLRRKEIN